MWCKGFDCIQYYFVEPEQEEEEEDTNATKSKGRKGKAGKSGPTKGTSGRKGKSGGASAAEGPLEEKGTVVPDMVLPVSMSAIIPNISGVLAIFTIVSDRNMEPPEPLSF